MGRCWCSGLRAGALVVTLAGVVGSFGCGQSQRSADIRADAGATGGTGGDGGSGAGGSAGSSAGGSAGAITIHLPCGDGDLDDDEECDDGNREPDDGCSRDCVIENPPCGDGVRARREACDDGNTVSDDGCRADCRMVEEGYLCAPGIPCTRYYQCGDSRVDPNE